MKRIRQYVAITVMAAVMGSGMPLMAGQYGQDDHSRQGTQYQSTGYHDRRDGGFRQDDQWHRERGDYDRSSEERGFRDNGGYSYGYAAPVYQSAPVYSGPEYNGSYDGRNHVGRTVAIIGGSAAAGALIGAAAGHGQGVVIGALIGGVAGAAASAAVNHRR